MLISAGIAPVCGAIVPGGPTTRDSRCKADGLLTSGSLHFDHEPPLRDDERGDRRAVENPRRIQLLCGDCHRAKTQRERGQL
jgi:5-methylcytosine-specific restriction endonuclease McrA